MNDAGDTYMDRLCDALADVLTHAAVGSKDRLACYVANFDFWVEEADHCLRLLKEYEGRFSRFQEAQQRVASEGQSHWHGRGNGPPPAEVTRSSSWNDRKEARRKVVGAMAKFLSRCAKEGLIDEMKRSATASRIS